MRSKCCSLPETPECAGEAAGPVPSPEDDLIVRWTMRWKQSSLGNCGGVVCSSMKFRHQQNFADDEAEVEAKAFPSGELSGEEGVGVPSTGCNCSCFVGCIGLQTFRRSRLVERGTIVHRLQEQVLLWLQPSCPVWRAASARDPLPPRRA